jgi:hypothetical protein
MVTGAACAERGMQANASTTISGTTTHKRNTDFFIFSISFGKKMKLTGRTGQLGQNELYLQMTQLVYTK